MKFSEKIGKTPLKEIIQIEDIDVELENRIWNNILINFFEKIQNYLSIGKESRIGEVCKIIWTDFFNRRVDEIPRKIRGTVDFNNTIKEIKKWYFKSHWYEKFDFIEFLSKIDNLNTGTGITEHFNKSLELEMSGYRIVNGSIVQVTSEVEIIEIEEAISFSTQYNSVNTHLNSALIYFSSRESPDYRNSIKESISAIESLCSIITEDKKATLGQALRVIEKKYEIHSAMKKGFSALYGYTSDSGGIRHKLLEDDINVSFEDAKFMLVSCSAFINYLKVKVNK